MKKVGILTFHDALNYGAVLQAYALQTFMSNQCGLDVEIIDYKPSYRRSFAPQKFSSKNPLKILWAKLQDIHYSQSFQKRNNRFLDFVANDQKLSKRTYTTIEEFENYCSDYDVLVTGSDQVFNPKIDSKIYYLGFNVKQSLKIAYAPSIGLSTLSKEAESMIAPWVRDFDALSCREEDGAKILSGLVGSKVPVVCDPVCLLDKKQWENVAIHPPVKDYIFVYDLNGGERLFYLAQKISCQTGLPIVYSTLKAVHPYVTKCETHHELGPKEWVGYISNASYVVTDSFHGTMFSLILGTPVFNKIAVKSTSSRIVSVMAKLGIKEQLIESVDKFDMNNIQLNPYQQHLDKFIEESKAYLISALNIINN